MFQSNSTREISYIFLWLIGIIAFYTLIHTYVLEPHTTSSTTHTNITLKNTKNVETLVVNTSPKLENNVIVKKEIITEEVFTAVSVPKKVATEASVVELKDITVQTVVTKKIEHLENIPQSVSTPSVPNVPHIIKVETVSIPSTPTLPSVPTVISLTPVSQPIVPIMPSTHIEPKALEIQVERFQNELKKDGELKLLESARQLVEEDTDL